VDPVRFAVDRPYTVAVVVILALIFSVLAYQRIPVQLKPSVDSPIITVDTEYRGASPEEVEAQVTRPIEDLLQSVDGIDKLTSSSVEGLSSVMLEYEWGVAKDRAVVDVINKLSELAGLPPDAEKPVVTLTGQQGANAVMWISSAGPYGSDRTRQIIADQVEPRLERVPGVASLMVVGGEEREIRVLVDPERLASRAVTWDALAAALRSGAVDLRGGTVETPTRQIVVRTEGRSTDPQSLADIIVRRDERGTVRVGDVASVVDGYRERSSVVHSDGQDIVAIGVRSEPDANVVELIAGVDRELDALNERFHQQGLDLSLNAVYRDTTYLKQALDFVWSNLWTGSALAVVVLLFFLRSIRSVAIITLSIPISLLTVFLVMDAFGRTLNVVSLAGLAFAAGMVVDNAIVVLENTFRHLEMGKSARDAAIDAGREVWGGVLASTLTTMVVFIPILGIKEEAGQLFEDLALAIAAAVGLSLVVSLTVVPCLAAIFYRRRAGPAGTGALDTIGAADTTVAPRMVAATGAGSAAAAGAATAAGGQGAPSAAAIIDERPPGAFTRWYGRSVERLAAPDRPAVTGKLLLVGTVVAVSVAAVFIVPKAGYLPAGNSNLIFFFGQPVPGMRNETLAAQAAPLERWIMDQPESERYFLVLAGAFQGGGVILKDEYANGPGLDAYQGKLFPVCMSVPGFRALIAVRSSLFRESGKQFTVQITGPDLPELATIAQRLRAELSSWPAVQPNGVTSDYVEGRPELTVRADGHLAGEAGLTVQEVGRVVETALAGRRVGTFSDGARDHDINLVVPQERVSSAEALRSLPLITMQGGRTTLGAVASLESGTGPVSVNRLERERAITLTVNLRPDAVLQAVLDDVTTRAIPPALAGMSADDSVTLGGSADKFSSTLAALTDSFWLALLITYLLLVALFRSWVSPVVIMVSVPLALSGGLFGITAAHAWSPDASFDLLSMLGFVILAGIVVNNAILIVHQSNNLRANGVERRLALAEAARTRLRPILMSVVTTVFGMLPLAIGRGAGAELYQGLAAVVTGGLVVSTVFTLFFVPALVSLGWDLGDAIARRRSARAVVTIR